MKLSGLYAITTPSQYLPQQVEAAIAGGARVIQYRDKSSDQSLRLEQAQQLNRICRAAKIPLIINDDVELEIISIQQDTSLAKIIKGEKPLENGQRVEAL